MILITGASGLLGVSLIAQAQKQGREVVGLYHQHPVSLAGARVLSVDLTQESQIKRIFEEFKPDTVIHCAAATNVDWCQEHREAAYRLNVVASARIAEFGVRMLHISTDSVFDGTRGDYTEIDQPAPVNAYAQTKLQSEHAVLGSNSLAAIARINLYGWNAQPKLSLAEWILGQLAKGKDVTGFTDAIFCPILANDLAEILLAMVDCELTGLFHVVGSEAVSKYEFARRVALKFGFDPGRIVPTSVAESSLRAPRPRNTSLNIGKVCASLKRAMPDVDSGLCRFAELRADGYVEKIRGELTRARE
jgi:dTDP-4-dehydrorhamnose reductase